LPAISGRVEDRSAVQRLPRPRSFFLPPTCQRSNLRRQSTVAGTSLSHCLCSRRGKGNHKGSPPESQQGRKKIGKRSPFPPRWSSPMRRPAAGPSRPLDGGVARRYNEFGGLLPRGQAQTIVFSDFSSWPRRTF